MIHELEHRNGRRAVVGHLAVATRVREPTGDARDNVVMRFAVVRRDRLATGLL